MNTKIIVRICMVGHIPDLVIGVSFAGFGAIFLWLGIFFNWMAQIPGYGPSVEIILTYLILGVLLLLIGGITLGIGYAKYQEVRKKRYPLVTTSKPLILEKTTSISEEAYLPSKLDAFKKKIKKIDETKKD